MNIPKYINNKLNQDKFKQIESNKFFLEEISLLTNKGVNQYYEYLIENIDLNQDNPTNSYIMWVVDKVSSINKDKPCVIQEGKSSLPDVDVDIEKRARKPVIQYLADKYNSDKVSSMITYQTLKGRGAIKNIMRAYGNTPFEEMNQITSHIQDESKVSSELQSMKEEMGESSIIRVALEEDREKHKGFKDKKPNKDNSLYEWCYIDDDGELAGPLNKRFAQAIRLEGTKTSQSKHPAGIIISPSPLNGLCPMVYDAKEETVVAGFEMDDLESLGLVKLDLLELIMHLHLKYIHKLQWNMKM